MSPGDKVICQHTDWCNAHGDDYMVARGERLTISETYRVGGITFLHFAEIEETDFCVNPGFLSTGFIPLRSVN